MTVKGVCKMFQLGMGILATASFVLVSGYSPNLAPIAHTTSKHLVLAEVTTTGRRSNGANFCPASLTRAHRPSCFCHQNSPDLTQHGKARSCTALFSSRNGFEEERNDRTLGVLVLLTVPLAWGTYAPVVRYVYEMNPPIPGFVFSAGYYLIATVSLLGLNMMRRDENLAQGAVEDQAAISSAGNMDGKNLLVSIRGGLELGGYLFLGNCLQVIGLKTVPADRAAFLVQLTTIMVPLLDAALKKDFRLISRQTWVSCILAFVGVIVMGYDGKELAGVGDALSAVVDTFTSGDLLIVFAAFAYTLHVVRLGRYAQYTTPLQLAAAKATTEAALSLALITFLVSVGDGSFTHVPNFISDMGVEVSSYFSTFGNAISTGALTPDSLLSAAGAILWTGLVTCAYTIYAQSYGQQRVSPTNANLIYTMQPVFSAFFAWTLLGETLGAAGYFGASLIGVSLALVTSDWGEAEEVNKSQIESTLMVEMKEDSLIEMKDTTESERKEVRNRVTSQQ
mmetsp:Transcript_51369/g.154342  ORF Transcript_51369/g.154342 Transcript_51369/m.154342 type:complete len:508 (-) Transcript_51369:462-1985(-)|eukprot:CAMPEP_0113544054 /NCGR_PEP_ID=MMETSP0015_2-20120614/10496_1 /TAXON_ID=2838 /ORGANISM="Odontella" /LENGTH=507 /DNA_ID=CAMNT_0000444273 /DNA_START=193 /DNA_END=1716 /DNA_ORIENTATION=- /assembly_acc=CAM_ASM_000160